MKTAKIPLVEWDWTWDVAASDASLPGELWWLLRHGRWSWMRHRRPLIFGAGRIWYDGPIWFLHIGWFSVDLSVD